MTKFLVDKKDNLIEGKMKNVTLGGKEILIACINGNYFAINNICSHAGAELHEGTLDNNELTCPWHGAKWDVETGNLLWFPQKLKSQESYKVSVEDDNIYVEM